MIAGDSGGKVLRRLDSAGSRFNRISGNGYGSAGAAGVGIEQVLLNENLLGRIGREHVGFVDVRGYHHTFCMGGNTRYADHDLAASLKRERNTLVYRGESRRIHFQTVRAGRICFYEELALLAGFCLRYYMLVLQKLDRCAGQGVSLPINHTAPYAVFLGKYQTVKNNEEQPCVASCLWGREGHFPILERS